MRDGKTADVKTVEALVDLFAVLQTALSGGKAKKRKRASKKRKATK